MINSKTINEKNIMCQTVNMVNIQWLLACKHKLENYTGVDTDTCTVTAYLLHFHQVILTCQVILETYGSAGAGNPSV